MFEIVLAMLVTILLVVELLQLLALGWRRYFSEIESWMKLLILSLASVLVVIIDEYALKWVSASGVTLAWLELLVMQGRYPYSKESISLMFYGVLKQMMKMFHRFHYG